MKNPLIFLLLLNVTWCQAETITLSDGSSTLTISQGSERESRDSDFVGLAWGSAGTSRRIENGVLRRREDGNLLDAGGLMSYVMRPGHSLWLGVSTDTAAEQAGSVLVQGAYDFEVRHDGLALMALTLEGGYSGERYAVADIDVLLGPLHFAYGREHALDAYSVGLGIHYTFDEKYSVRLTADRMAIYADGNANDEAHLATQASLEIALNLKYFMAFASGGFVHDAVGDLDGGESWQVCAGIAVRLW